MRWPRADSFTVSRALGRTYLRLSRFCNILLQDLAQSHVKITRSTNLLSVCQRKLKLLTYALFKLQQHKLSQSSGFYSITWRMISRSAGYKIHFLKQPLFRGNFVPCRCDIFRFFEFILLGNSSSTAHVFSYNQINKQPENLYVSYRKYFGYFTLLAETSLFEQCNPWS